MPCYWLKYFVLFQALGTTKDEKFQAKDHSKFVPPAIIMMKTLLQKTAESHNIKFANQDSVVALGLANSGLQVWFVFWVNVCVNVLPIHLKAIICMDGMMKLTS